MGIKWMVRCILCYTESHNRLGTCPIMKCIHFGGYSHTQQFHQVQCSGGSPFYFIKQNHRVYIKLSCLLCTYSHHDYSTLIHVPVVFLKSKLTPYLGVSVTLLRNNIPEMLNGAIYLWTCNSCDKEQEAYIYIHIGNFYKHSILSLYTDIQYNTNTCIPGNLHFLMHSEPQRRTYMLIMCIQKVDMRMWNHVSQANKFSL